MNFENFPQGCRDVTLGKYDKLVLWLVYYLVAKVCRSRIRSHLVSVAE